LYTDSIEKNKIPDGSTFVNDNDIGVNASDIKLEYVGNNVSDISPLLKLENLLYLNVTNNPINENDKQILSDFMLDNYLLK
jgi:hypothetical protein